MTLPLPQSLASIIAVVLLTACAGAPPDTTAVDLRDSLGARAGGELRLRRTADERAVAHEQTADILKGELSLDGALKVALLNAPRLQVATATLAAAAAERASASEISNPVLAAQARPTVSPAALANLEFGLLTSLIDILTRPAREKIAGETYMASRLATAAEISAAATTLRTAYIDLVAAEHTRAVQAELSEAAATSAALAEKFHDAGNIPVVRLKQEQAAAAEVALALSDAELDVAAAREHLALQMGVSAEGEWTVPNTLPTAPDAPFDRARIGDGALERRLDVMAARAAVKASLADLQSKTDWKLWQKADLSVSGERDGSGQWAIGPRLEIALPLFNRGNAAVAHAAALTLKVDNERAAVENIARSEQRQTLMRLTQAERRLDRYRKSLLPLRSDIVALKTREYNYMFIGAFEVLTARKDEAAADLGYVRTLRDYWQSRVAVDAAFGGGTPAAAMGDAP